MPKLPKAIGWNLLWYTTAQRVHLKDRLLGFLSFFFSLCILAYIIVIVVVMRGGYLKLAPPVGVVRITYLEPNYTAINATAGFSNYCTNYGASEKEGVTRPCAFFPGAFIANPPSGVNNIVIASHLLVTSSISPCVYCKAASTISEEFYLGGVEYGTLFFDHSVRSVEGNIQRNVAEMTGRWKDCHGKVWATFNPRNSMGRTSYIKSTVITVRQLVALATCSLDSFNEPAGVFNNVSTIREDGTVILVSIVYDNTRWLRYNDVTYTATVRKVPAVNFRTSYGVPFLSANGSASASMTTTLLNVNGVLIATTQSGSVGIPDFSTLLLQLSAGLTLLAIAYRITDFCALHILPDRKKYREYLFRETENFTELRKKQGRGLGKLLTKALGMDEHGDHAHQITTAEQFPLPLPARDPFLVQEVNANWEDLELDTDTVAPSNTPQEF